MIKSTNIRLNLYFKEIILDSLKDFIEKITDSPLFYLGSLLIVLCVGFYFLFYSPRKSKINRLGSLARF
jgi:hypothetical protein